MSAAIHSAEINVGYIGLGNIGKPSAERLAASQFPTFVYDIDAAAIAALAAQGATACDSPAALAAQCQHIGICVRDDAQVEALLFGAAGQPGLLASANPDSTIAIHSTVTQANIIKWSQQASERGLHLIDAPITGGAHKAADGTLCYMVGGSQDITARVEPIFMTSAEKVVHAGDIGAGIALKLCNNFIQYGEFLLMAEATALADRCGLSADVLREVGLANGVVNDQMHRFISGRNAVAASGDAAQMEQFFGAMGALGRKDLECTIQTASDHELALPAAEYLRDRIEDLFLARDGSAPTKPE